LVVTVVGAAAVADDGILALADGVVVVHDVVVGRVAEAVVVVAVAVECAVAVVVRAVMLH
jgi:hypothetical protein